MRKIIHVISNLEDGGAENTLYRLCLNSPAFEHIVVCMMGPGKYGPMLEESGIQVYCLMMPQGKITLKGIFIFLKLLRAMNADTIQTWMYHADLFGGLLGKLLRVKKIIWGIRHGNLETGTLKKRTIFVAKLCSVLSYWVPLKIISCSEQAIKAHVTFGYCKDKFVAIPNGYDFSRVRSDQLIRMRLRAEWNIPDNVFLIGMVARYDLQKDHINLFAAMKLLKERGVLFHCILVGSGMVASNQLLINSLLKFNVQDFVSLMGPRNDIPAVMSSIDLHVLSSLGEGFPNVLVEAMACETPCVSTNVGDAQLIVGDTGWIVPRKDPESLACGIQNAWNEFNEFSFHWNLRKNNARQRVVNKYSIDKVANLYANVWGLGER